MSTLVRQRTLFAEHQEQIEQWLERETTMNAAEILRRLIRLAPGTYHARYLPRGSAALDVAARQGMASSPGRAAAGLGRTDGKGTQKEETTNAVATQ